MPFRAQWAILALMAGGLGGSSSAQMGPPERDAQEALISPVAGEKSSRHPNASQTLTPDDGLSVITAALDSRVRLRSESDCSHLVHAIYERAGFSYAYASSSSLYSGTREFQRVSHPQPGDLVVWRGHVGIVVNPAQRSFFSTLGSGPGIDNYDAPYWKHRGKVRFYRYVNPDPPRNAPNRLVLTHHSK